MSDKPIIPFGYVRLISSDKMMRAAWMAYDSDGSCISSGVLGMGSLTHDDKATAIEIRAGLDAYAIIKDLCKEKGGDHG